MVAVAFWLKCDVYLQVYHETHQDRETKEFSSVLTPADMYEQLKMQTQKIQYHRIPMSDDQSPTEQVTTSISKVF